MKGSFYKFVVKTGFESDVCLLSQAHLVSLIEDLLWARGDSVTSYFLLKILATPTRRQALVNSSCVPPPFFESPCYLQNIVIATTQLLSYFVGTGRLELPSLSALVPKTSAYTNSATYPYYRYIPAWVSYTISKRFKVYYEL